DLPPLPAGKHPLPKKSVATSWGTFSTCLLSSGTFSTHLHPQRRQAPLPNIRAVRHPCPLLRLLLAVRPVGNKGLSPVFLTKNKRQGQTLLVLILALLVRVAGFAGRISAQKEDLGDPLARVDLRG